MIEGEGVRMKGNQWGVGWGRWWEFQVDLQGNSIHHHIGFFFPNPPFYWCSQSTASIFFPHILARLNANGDITRGSRLRPPSPFLFICARLLSKTTRIKVVFPGCTPRSAPAGSVRTGRLSLALKRAFDGVSAVRYGWHGLMCSALFHRLPVTAALMCSVGLV